MDFSFYIPIRSAKADFLSTSTQVDGRSLTANLKQAFRETDWLKRILSANINVLMAGKPLHSFPLEFFEGRTGGPYSIIITPDKTTELVQYNILHKNNISDRTVLGWTKAPAPFYANEISRRPFLCTRQALIKVLCGKRPPGQLPENVYVHLQKQREIYA